MKSPILLTLALAVSSSALTADDSTHWSYVGVSGPEHWGELDPRFALCNEGEQQSPVDLTNFVDVELPPIGFDYQPGGSAVLNNGHSVQVNYDPGSTITLDDRDYELKQFHFHAPSENQVNGKAFPMEAHLVHADADGNLAVIAVMFEEGAENSALANPWSLIPKQADTSASLEVAVSAEDLLPEKRDYYRFDGSLTTPPCTEGVLWLVMVQPVTASAEQISTFEQVVGQPNNRPIQQRNARVILE